MKIEIIEGPDQTVAEMEIGQAYQNKGDGNIYLVVENYCSNLNDWGYRGLCVKSNNSDVVGRVYKADFINSNRYIRYYGEIRITV